jgi:hypothetical protein
MSRSIYSARALAQKWEGKPGEQKTGQGGPCGAGRWAGTANSSDRDDFLGFSLKVRGLVLLASGREVPGARRGR